MKKYFLIISSFLLFFAHNSCSERDLDLFPPDQDEITDINSEAKMQMLLNGAYLSVSASNVYGTDVMLFGDLMGDKLFVSNTNPSYLNTFNYNYNSSQSDFGFYGTLYNVIMNCNLVINNTAVASNANVNRIKGEAKIIRGLAYFTLVNYYSPTPTSGVNQDYGVPLVLSDYDVKVKPARATVPQVYDQIIADLKAGVNSASDSPSKKVILSKTAAKLLLSRVYLTRRAAGDSQLALDYATDIVFNSPSTFAKINATALTKPYNSTSASMYEQYFSGSNEDELTGSETYKDTLRAYTLPGAENHPETIWELDLNINSNRETGIGSNISLPGYYHRTDSRKCMLFNQTFYNSFPATDVRRGTNATGLLTNTSAPKTDTPGGYWTNKYPRFTKEGNYFRNIKVLRFAEAQLNRIEALFLTGQNAQALTELNAFAASRKGSLYTGTDLLKDILTEKGKEFYGEGQRFLDLKRNNLSMVRPSNCSVNCTVTPDNKLFVLPMSQGALNSNKNLKQYPGYN
ncbi:RagB/SusD family nutrient uptake outer membrane protein [Kaistella flava (ex Peng et al. 2021)]|uniref:RagB/SusD family nutrient uptake outer membrane protein n=1 Tax=Kaistella flava (ex Peng et al. 2021) TaxID=2038776 RepID=A0A7M2Y9U5_9FLAO|nr:RagB/SusD family nutrient uptake outer membrane protein [Kaistella flava (ex Peng et al. 2021)]QOW10866.1 RagB/SusD family nutrient uptake outer membrane protein [Kaistella flava (ex Peng et al. 2021)]